MPPVFGPWSPSSRALWSWLVAIGSTCSPSTMQMKLASSPSRNSSITTRAPASPKALPSSMSRTAASASASVRATTTPLPAASPSALMTMGAPFSRMYSSAGPTSANTRYSAVGMRCRARKSLAKALLPSSCAAFALGPKQRRPSARKASTMPPTSGASGPTTVSATFSRRAKAISAAKSMGWMGTFSTPGSCAVPALPGATNTLSTRGDCASFHASACSRPPLPMTRIFMCGTHLREKAADYTGGGNARPAASAMWSDSQIPSPPGLRRSTSRSCGASPGLSQK